MYDKYRSTRPKATTITMFATPTEYNDHLIQNLTKITLEDYFKAYHSQFYSDQDISFMEYFLKLCGHKHEYYVPHTKLFEYGIMSESSNSKDVRRRLEVLKLKNDIHYQVGKVSLQSDSSRGAKHTHIYMLKPKAFKKLLMRAGKNSKQVVNVEIYADYYLLLEDVHADYTEYEHGYSKRINSFKDKKIDEQSQKLDKQSEKIDKLIDQNDKLIEMNQNQSQELSKLMVITTDTATTLKSVEIELAELKIQMAKVIKAVYSLAYMPNIYQRFYDQDHAGKKVRDNKRFSLTSIGKTKSLVFVATYDPTIDQLKIECVNRKLNEPLTQINTIIGRSYRHNKTLEDGDDFQMVLMPKSYGVSTLHEQEIRSIYSNKVYLKEIIDEFELTNVTWSTKYKAIIMTGVESLETAQNCFDRFIEITQTANIHSYDKSLEQSIIQSGEFVSPEALDELKKLNTRFATESKKLIDNYYCNAYRCCEKYYTYIRAFKEPKIELTDLKNGIRELVIAGVEFE